MGLDIDLYTPKIDIGDDGADDIIIEITGLKSLSKFIGLEDTPLYYDNGKFFKVEDNKIVYTDIEWKDISGNLEDAPEIVTLIEKLVEEISAKVIDHHMYLHNLDKDAHPYIQNIIHENYVTLDTKIDDTKEELSQDISNLNDALNQEISDRETADNALSEDIQEEILARIDGDTTLQGKIDILNTNLQNEIDDRIEGDTNLSNSLDELSNNLIQEVLNRQEQDGILQEQITSNYNTLDDKIDTEISNRTSADTTLQNNINAETSARQNADTTLQGNIDELTQTVEDNNTAVNNRIDETNDTVSNLSDTVTSNYNTLNGKIDTEISNRTLADTTLQNNINAEALTRQNADATLQNNINAEALARQNADTTLQNNIDAEALARQNADVTLQGNIDALSDTVSSNYNDLSDQIDNLSDTVSDNYTDLNGKISDLTTIVNDNDTAINSKVDGINTTLTTSINNLSNTVSSNYTTLDTKIDNTKTSLEGDISDLSDTVSQNYTDLNNTITTSASTINSRIDSEVSTLNTAISTETANRQNADNNLQSQIDAIVSSSDVFDIVGTYAELQAYDISTVPVNDIVKVLVDSSHNNTATYYRCVETSGVKSWSYIGSEGAYYTKSESDTKFVAKTTTINNKPLSSNITLTASDVNALPDTTVIGNGILTLQKNGVNIDTFNANATANKSINITVPTDTADLTNGAGFITSASLPTVNNGTLTIQANGTTVGTFTANQAGNTTANIVVPDSATWGNITGTLSNQTDLQTALGNFVTLNTAQTISAVKTFSAEPLINSNIQFGNVSTGSRGIWGKVGDNDYWRVYGGATATNTGYMELATADDGNEPIYIRQYTGQFSTLKRTATILDASGNTSFPGSVTATSFIGNASSATKATQDASGNTITTTYATKTEMNAVNKNTMRSTEFIVGTQTASTGSWTGVTEDTLLYNGKRITYYLPYSGSGNATLTLTFPDGTNSGAKNIYTAGTTRLTTHYGANSVIPLTYYADKDGWFVDGDRDVNNYERLQNSNNLHTRGAITANTIIVAKENGYKTAASGVTFDISYPILFSPSAIDNDKNFTSGYYAYPSIALTNTKSGWTGTQWSVVYMVGTLTGTIFTIDSAVLTTTIPTTADGKVYTPIGVCYDTTHCYFRPSNDYYAYRDGSFQRISTKYVQGSATQPIYFDSNGQPQNTTYTLSKSVPSDAVFTDTKNTAGSTNTSSKIFLVGATSQAANPQTYSHDTAFVDTNGRVNSAAPANDANDTTVATTKWVKDQSYVTTNTAQTISGTKTFTGTPVFSNDAIGAQLTVNRSNNASGYSVIKYTNNGTVKGYLGVHYEGRPIWGNSSGTYYNLIRNSTLDTAVGTATKGVYINSGGVATAMTYELKKTVPSDAVFTDTKNTAGSTDSSSKLFLVGATSQATNPQTYSHDTAFVDTDGALNSVTPTAGNNSTKVATTAFVTTAIGSYVKKAGDTMTGALNFANGTWNKMGDDASIGDQNVGGHICIKPNNSTYDNSGGLSFHNSSGTALAQLNASSGVLTSSGALGLSNNAAKMQYNSTTEAIEFVFA